MWCAGATSMAAWSSPGCRRTLRMYDGRSDSSDDAEVRVASGVNLRRRPWAPGRHKLWVANSSSSGDRSLKQTSTMLPPSVAIECRRSGGGRSGELCRCRSSDRAVHTMGVVIARECVQLSRQVRGVPEEHLIEVLAPDRSDQPFDEWMRHWSIRNRLDLVDLEDAQVGEPAVEAEQRVVVGADVFRSPCALTPLGEREIRCSGSGDFHLVR